MTDDQDGLTIVDVEGVYHLDEATLRRPGWAPYLDVTLANGQAWALPGIGPLEALMIPELCDLVSAFPDATTADVEHPAYWHEQIRIDAALREIGCRLLALNYSLDESTALRLTTCLLEQDKFNTAVLQILSEGSAWWRATSPYRHDGCLFFN